MLNFWTHMLNQAKIEQDTIDDSRIEVAEKNNQVMKTITLACTFVMGVSLVVSFFNHTFDIAGISYLRYAYLLLVIFSFSTYLVLRFVKNLDSYMMVYIVNSLAAIYGFIISAFVAPDSVSVTFVTIIFMAATVYIDVSWRINLFIVVATGVFLASIYQYKAPDAFSAEFINSTIIAVLAMTIGGIVRSARIENFAARKKLHRQAFTDQLTGLSNRRMLFEMLSNTEDSNNLNMTAFSIIDLDYFKKYNDTYGHQAGDECLQVIAACFLAFQLRYNISFYRYGGEEFVITYNNYTMQEIEDLLDELYLEVERLHIEHKASEFGYVTLSIGTAAILEHTLAKYEATLAKADIALYQAKSSGRNMALFYDSSMEVLSENPLANTRQR